MPHRMLRLTELSRQGSTLTPDEAAAITLAVAEELAWREPPHGLDWVLVGADGTVQLADAGEHAPGRATHYADLLQRLLALGHSDQRPRAPGAVLLLIARARGEIDLPAFATPQQFGQALQRFVTKPVRSLIGGVVARACPADSTLPSGVRTTERRTTGPRVDELRRMLREADFDRIALERRLATAPRQHDVTAPTSERRTTGPRVDELRRMLRDSDLARIALAQRVREYELDVYARPTSDDPSGVETSSGLGAPRGGAARRAVVIAGLLTASFLGGALFLNPRGAASVSSTVRAVTGHQSPVVTRSAGDNHRPDALRREITDTRSSPPAGPTHAEPASALEQPPANGREIGTGTTPAGNSPPAAARQSLHPLPVPAPAAYSPSFSPDGDSIYFHGQTREGSGLMRADTNLSGGVLEVATIVDDGAQNFHVRLSPDGSRIAFDSDRDGVRGVYIAARDGTGVRRVSGDGYAAVPVWSPDGSQLLYLRGEDAAPRTWNLWRVTLETGEQQRLTSHRYGQAWPGSWFADASRVCYTHEDRLYVLDLRTGRARAIASPVRGRLVRTASVSPSGRYVAYQVYRDGMWLLDLRDGSSRRVLDDSTAEEFTWSPDGQRLAFHSRRDGRWGVWVMASPQ